MRCEDIQTRRAAYVLGELLPEERRLVQGHLRQCAACQAALAQTDWLAAALLKADAPPVPAGLGERVMAAAYKRQREMPVAAWNPLAWWRAAPAAMRAAAVLCLLIGVGAGFGLGWASAPVVTAERPAAQDSPLELYSLDYLGAAPAGSLAERYMALATGTEKGGR
ncbi:MAG: zf-HC2 domain-containing protein [Candidatus Hydrogenedentota bacterium]